MAEPTDLPTASDRTAADRTATDRTAGWGDATRSVHTGQPPDPATGAVSPPLVLASTFQQDAVGVLRSEYEYARSQNPTRERFERAIAGLESPDTPATGLAFGSGLAATDTVLRTVLQPGAHVVMSDDVYGGTYRQMATSYADWGVRLTQVDATDLAAVAAAIEPGTTRLVWVETPSNPLLAITDIEGTANATHAAGALLAVDNTFATPMLQRPLSLGADLVVHSATKYLGGHSDLVMGAVVVPDGELAERVRVNQNSLGAVAGPFDCWLALRGLRTLWLRMRQHCASALFLAEHLAGRDDVLAVRYPGLAADPGHQVAARQMSGFGGMVSFRVAGGADRARSVVEQTNLFILAESLGGVESLIELPAAMTHQSSAGSARPVPGDLIRVSVGVEDPADLWADLVAALER